MANENSMAHLSAIIVSIKNNTDNELILIKNINNNINTIANGINELDSSLNFVNKNLNSISDNLKNNKIEIVEESPAKKIIPSISDQINNTDIVTNYGHDKNNHIANNITTNNATNNIANDVTTNKAINNIAPPAKKADRNNETTLVTEKRIKPTFINKSNQNQSVISNNSNSSNDVISNDVKTIVSSNKALTKQIEKNENLLSSFWRDEKGRLRHKSGRYASTEENKAYETAERERDKANGKNKNVIARLVDSLRDININNNQHTDAEETAGAAAGSSFYYAARDIFDLGLDVKDNIVNVADRFSNKESSFVPKAADTVNQIDNDNNNNKSNIDNPTSIKDKNTNRQKSDRKQELRNQSEQTETLKEQSSEQKTAYAKLISLLDDIVKNTKPKSESLLKSIGSLASLFQGKRGLGSLGDISIPDNAKDDKKKSKKGSKQNNKSVTPSSNDGKKASNKKRGRNKKQSIKVDTATEVKNKSINKSVLDNGVENTPKPKSAVLSKVASSAKLLKAIPLIGAMATVGDTVLDLKDRDDLDVSQKAVKATTTIGSTAAGGLAGAKVGALTGATIGSVIPVVGTAIGGIVGSMIGALGGAWIGDKAGNAVGDNITKAMSKDKSISETLNLAWDDTIKDSEKTLKNVFGSVFGGLFGLPDNGNESTDYSQYADHKKGDATDKRISKHDSIINNAATKNNVDPDLIKTVIRQESKGKINAVSHVGAQGLMQLMPATAKDLNVKDSFDPEQNINGGTKYLSQHIKKYSAKGYNNDDSIKLALASYNAGGGWVDSAIEKSGNSKNGEAVLAALRDPTLTRNGKTRSADNIKQSDQYVKKIFGNYQSIKNEKYSSSAGTQTALASIEKNTVTKDSDKTVTAIKTNNQITTDSVNAIDAKNQNAPKQPQKVILAKNDIPSSNIKTVKNTDNNNVTTNNTSNNLVVKNNEIPVDFDDQSLRLQSWDRN